MNCDAYHVTDSSVTNNILKEGFKPRFSKTHYLGQGTYCFELLDIAKLYVASSKKESSFLFSRDPSILKVSIKVDDINYLNLDDHNELLKFEEYMQKEIESGLDNITLKYQNKKNANCLITYFYLDLYKRDKNYYVVRKTFTKSRPSYSYNPEGPSYWGLNYLETYICISDNKSIEKIDLYAI